MIVFYPKYWKTIFSGIISVKNTDNKSSIFGKIKGLAPFENVNFWLNFKLQFSALKIILFYTKYPKTTFFDIISVSNTDKNKFHFRTKSMDKPFWKMSILWPYLNLQFFGLKVLVFYPKYRKTIFSNFRKKHIQCQVRFFWQNPLTNPFGKCPFLALLKTSYFSS